MPDLTVADQVLRSQGRHEIFGLQRQLETGPYNCRACGLPIRSHETASAVVTLEDREGKAWHRLFATHERCCASGVYTPEDGIALAPDDSYRIEAAPVVLPSGLPLLVCSLAVTLHVDESEVDALSEVLRERKWRRARSLSEGSFGPHVLSMTLNTTGELVVGAPDGTFDVYVGPDVRAPDWLKALDQHGLAVVLFGSNVATVPAMTAADLDARLRDDRLPAVWSAIAK